jgi:hypothetical protein
VTAVAYSIAGVRCSVSAPPEALEWVDDIYGPFRTAEAGGAAVSLRLEPDGDVRALIESVGDLVGRELGERGIYPIHAASLSHEGEGLILTGPSGAGKTTLCLALLGRGLGFLSDEYALSLPDARTIAPFPRAPQVRAGTPELVPELGFLFERAPSDLGFGPRWGLRPDELERAFPGCPGGAVPLRHIVFVGPPAAGQSVLEPVEPGFAAVELARLTITTISAAALAPILARTSRLVDGARVARLRPASLERSVEVVLDWLG